MSRPKIPVERKRVKISLHPLPDVLGWVDAQIAAKQFYNRTHAFEFAISKLMGESGQANKTKK